MPPKLGQIVETILYTSDVTKMVEWYMRAFGLKPFTQAPALAGFALPNNTLLLIFDRSTTTKDKKVPGGTIPKHGSRTDLGQHIAFACSGADELREWEDHFQSEKIGVFGRMNWERGGKSIYVKDWEGHVIEIMTTGVWPVY